MPKLGLIGCGAMGSALAKGIVKHGGVSPDNFYVYDIVPERMEYLVLSLGCRSGNLEELCRECDLLILAVKPQDVENVLASMAGFFRKEQLLVSVAAGISTRSIEKLLPAGSKVIRLMPNTPCLIGAGAVAVSSGKEVTLEELEYVESLLTPLGMVKRVPEKLMEAVTGLSGSGPAFAFYFIEALIDGGVEAGLSRDLATDLAAQTVLGAARMLLESGRHPAELKNAVTSPGGTTSAGLLALEEGAARAAIIKAVTQAARRAGELKRE